MRTRQGAPITPKRRPTTHYSTMETRRLNKTRPISGLGHSDGKFLTNTHLLLPLLVTSLLTYLITYRLRVLYSQTGIT